MKKKEMGFGIVGTGMIANFHAQAVLAMQDAKLCGVYDYKMERAQGFGLKYGCAPYNCMEEMLSEPRMDIVLLATPSGLHRDVAIQAAEAGKHVLCEKPLEITVARIDEMIAAHERSGTYLGCIFQLRYMEVLEAIRGLLASNALGTLTYAGVYVPWWRSDEYYAGSSWHGTKAIDGGGALINQSIHMIDILCDLMPPIKKIAGFISSAGHPFIETEDAAAASLLFEGGAVGVIYGSTSAWPGMGKRLEISGTRGTLVLQDEDITVLKLQDGLKEVERELLSKFGRKPAEAGVGASRPDAIGHLLHQRCFEDFARAVATGGEYSIDGVSARRSVEVIEAIYNYAGN